ncbi:hypothetical protein FV226_26300 [Methylobacterium sp. WL12]|uniref:hypothetical protein n=1 Tax=Methylobacterium sp. WL12 TaxID=2603890 RepID=UPI0011CB25A0|nr:hypothetical protein [Methylobacterium sp. WL12]TXM64588.1 hypothetical protein FV226_26300 [Methylobacterium sp. WL12]
MSIEIIIIPSPSHKRRYDAYLGTTLLCTSRIPFYDGARELLKLGYPPEALVNMRHRGKAYPSFVPIELAQAAKLTVRENDEDGLRVRLYEPYQPRERNWEQATAFQFGSKPAGSVTGGNEAVSGI